MNSIMPSSSTICPPDTCSTTVSPYNSNNAELTAISSSSSSFIINNNITNKKNIKNDHDDDNDANCDARTPSSSSSCDVIARNNHKIESQQQQEGEESRRQFSNSSGSSSSRSSRISFDTTTTTSRPSDLRRQQKVRRPRRQRQHYSVVLTATRTTTTTIVTACNSSNCLYILGSCLYVILAIWDIHNEQNWYTTTSTTTINDDDYSILYPQEYNDTAIGNTTINTRVESDNSSDDVQPQQDQFFATVIFQMLFQKNQHDNNFSMDPYLLTSIAAALCYVIDAIMLLRTTTTIRRDTNDTDGNNNEQQPSLGNNVMPQQQRHRFHPKNGNCFYMTLLIAITFGLGATLELLSAITTEWYRYPSITSYAVVGAAHIYLLNAILVLYNAPTPTAAATATITNIDLTTSTTSSRNTPLPPTPTQMLLPSFHTMAQMNVSILADRLFLAGSLVDASLSYFYIGGNNEGFSDTVWKYIYFGYLCSSILWLINALCYFVADIRSIAMANDDAENDIVDTGDDDDDDVATTTTYDSSSDYYENNDDNETAATVPLPPPPQKSFSLKRYNNQRTKIQPLLLDDSLLLSTNSE